MEDYKKRCETLEVKYKDLQARHARLKLSMDVCPEKLEACAQNLERETALRARAENSLAALQERLSGILAALPLAWCAHTLDGHIHTASARFSARFGRPGQGAAGQNIRDLLPERHQNGFEQYIAQLQDETAMERTVKIRKPGGGEESVEYTAVLEKDGAGPEGVYVFVREEQAPGPKHKEGSPLCLPGTAVARVAEMGTVRDANPAFLRLFGLARESLAEGIRLESLVDEDSKDTFTARFLEARAPSGLLEGFPCGLRDGKGKTRSALALITLAEQDQSQERDRLVGFVECPAPFSGESGPATPPVRAAEDPGEVRAGEEDSGDDPEEERAEDQEDQEEGRRGWAREIGDVPGGFKEEVRRVAADACGEKGVPLRTAIAHFEREYIGRLLGMNRWHRGRVADILEVDRRTLLRKITGYGIGRP
jgi:PAS domain S-box-containing protein